MTANGPKVTFGDLDLTGPTYEGAWTIDPRQADHLGPANAEQRAERKDSPAQKALNAVVLTVVLVIAGVVVLLSGVYIGATDPDIWEHVPGVPSGERSEPWQVAP